MREINISSFPWAEFSFVENRDQIIIDTLGLQRKKRSKGHHRYEAEMVTVDMAMDEGRDVKAQISDGHDALLKYVHPRLSYTSGIEPAIGIFTNNTYTSGLRDIAFTSTSAWQLKSGDYLTFENHTKVYELVGSTLLTPGVQTVRLAHELQQAVTIGERVTVNDVEWSFISDGVVEVSMEAVENQDMQLTLNVVEDI